MTLAARLAALGTATLAEVAPDARLPEVPWRAVAPGMRMAGPARTVRCRPGDNLALHLAMDRARPGELIVVDYGGSVASGPFGEIMALACQLRGVAGLLIDGAVRDSEQIAALGFAVFARGLNIRGTLKADRGEQDALLTLGGVQIGPGDVIVADADAVLVLPAALAEDAARAGEARAARERAMIDRLRAGETTLDILGLTR